MFNGIIHWLTSALGGLNYFDITLLMAIESSFLPLPSELILPPAGYLAAAGVLKIHWIIIAGTFGSLIGATFNYYLARILGRPILHRLAKTGWAKWLLISEKKLITAEQYYHDRGHLATFLGRLLPVVRHLISLPAGLAKMNLGQFWLATALGACLWTTILTMLGYWFGANQTLLAGYYYQLKLGGAVIIIAGLLYLIFKHVKKQ